MSYPRLLLAGLVSFIVGCTAIQVEPLAKSDLPTPQVCIERNPRVLVEDFVDVMRAGFSRHGIASEVYDTIPADGCEVVVTYTARQTWDLVRYLAKAEIWMKRQGRQVAHAEYHLRGGGGYALTKYEGTSKKMRPVFDRLLQQHKAGAAPAAALSAAVPVAAPAAQDVAAEGTTK
jgi:hypothetical protein